MSTRRIGDLPNHRLVEFKPCTHPEHLPHSHVVLPPGVYRHTCPSCGDSFEFSVWDGPTLCNDAWGRHCDSLDEIAALKAGSDRGPEAA